LPFALVSRLAAFEFRAGHRDDLAHEVNELVARRLAWDGRELHGLRRPLFWRTDALHCGDCRLGIAYERLVFETSTKHGADRIAEPVAVVAFALVVAECLL